MKWHRVNALIIRHLYLYKRSFPRIMDILYWPLMELLLWGFLSLYLQKTSLAGINIFTLLLGGIIFWDILSQSQRAVSVAFLEDVWEKNFLNIFVTPLRVSEFILSTFFLGLIRIILSGTIMVILALLFYKFSIFIFGLSLIPFILNLLFFGWILGLFTTAIILRYGTSAQVLAFGLIFLIQPFSAVFYPVSVLPNGVQFISYLLPSTHVFEGMREVIATHSFSMYHFLSALLLNAIYMVLIFIFFYKMLSKVKEKGRLLKLD